MIALASSRILQLGARLWKVSAPSGSYREVYTTLVRATALPNFLGN
jgi:hypothetical protein